MVQRYRYSISQARESERLLKKGIKDICKKVGEDTVHKLQTYIKLYWYDRYSPEDYKRTGDFVDAVGYEIQNETSVVIYIDFTKIRHRAEYDNWGQHVGFDGNDFTEGLVEFIEDGRFSSGKRGSPNNPRFGKGSKAIEKTMNWLNKKVNSEIMRQVNVLINRSFS